MTNGNDFTHPSTHQNSDGTHDFNINKGLTKREYFAAMAMQASISTIDSSVLKKADDWLEEPNRIAQWAVRYADALIAELNK